MSSNKTQISLPTASKAGNKIQIGKPLTKPLEKPKAALPGLCDYGSGSDSDKSEDEEEIEPLKLPPPVEKKVSGLLGILPPPKQNQFMNKKAPKQSSTPSDFFTASSKNTSTTFKDASSLVPRTIKSKQPNVSTEYDAPVSSKKMKPSYETYVNKPDPVIPTFAQYAAGVDPDPEPEAEEDEEEEIEYRAEEFGGPAFDAEAIRQLSNI